MSSGSISGSYMVVIKYVNILLVEVDKTKNLTLQEFSKAIFPHINSPNSNKVYINK